MDPEVSPLIGETGLRRKGHVPPFSTFLIEKRLQKYCYFFIYANKFAFFYTKNVIF